MRALHRIHALIATILVAIPMAAAFQSPSFGVEPRFTWMLPKTVIDATIVYTFVDCTDDKGIQLSIAPTLTPRTVPDPLVRGAVDTQAIPSFWQDRNISIQTFNGSRILSSIGSSPTSQVAAIGGNILGGIAKLVGIVLGTSPVPGPMVQLSLATKCAPDSDPKSAKAIVAQIKALKDSINKLQKELAGGADDTTQKKDNAAITAAQSLIVTLQNQISITIKTTIDPGITNVMVDPDGALDFSRYYAGQSDVDHSGLVATICPSAKQLDDAHWFTTAVFPLGPCALQPSFEVNVYMDFAHAQGSMFDATHAGSYQQTPVYPGEMYRDVAYIPVIAWRGAKPAAPQNPPIQLPADASFPPVGPVQLTPPQMMAFGQFGVSQKLPLTAGTFQSLSWSLTFLEDGEMTGASFKSGAEGIGATSLFGSAVSAANSIATEQRTATSAATLATKTQSQADEIYQANRLAICQLNPATCPSK
jgi:hypothetical protein